MHTRVKIEKINNLFQVDINRREQGYAAHYEQYCQHVVTALFNCNNLEQHGWQLVHSWTRNIVYACRYQLETTCAFLAVYVFWCAEVLILMDTACKIQPNESPWSPLLKVAFRLKNDCRAPLTKISYTFNH